MIHTYVTTPQVDIPLAAEYLEPACESIWNVPIPIWGNPHVVQMMIQDVAIASNNVYSDPLLQAVQPVSQGWVEIDAGNRTSYQGMANGAICRTSGIATGNGRAMKSTC